MGRRAQNDLARTNTRSSRIVHRPFIDWMGSRAGQDSIEALDLVFGELGQFNADVGRRKVATGFNLICPAI